MKERNPVNAFIKRKFNSETITHFIKGDGQGIIDQTHILKEEHASVLDNYNQDVYEHFLPDSVDMQGFLDKARDEIDLK